MDDLLEELSRIEPSTTDDVAPARARLTAAIDEELAAPARRRRSRFVLSGAAVVGLAAAITGVVTLGPLQSVGVVPAQAEAEAILLEAADVLRALPSTPPRPDQFVYTKTRYSDGGVREAWLSADGTHDGLVRQYGDEVPLPGCRDGRSQMYRGTELMVGMFDSCVPRPAYDPATPTDPAAMHRYLSDMPGHEDRTVRFARAIQTVVQERYVTPASLAAIFEVVAETDGLGIVRNATDGAGRQGIGVTWVDDGPMATLVFDERTHTFLGMVDADRPVTEAVVEQAVVDTAGQRP
jgi:hypothetical protein